MESCYCCANETPSEQMVECESCYNGVVCSDCIHNCDSCYLNCCTECKNDVRFKKAVVYECKINPVENYLKYHPFFYYFQKILTTFGYLG